MEMIQEFLQSGLLPAVLLILRAVVPVLALYVVWRSYTSFQKGQRRRDPVVVLWDEGSNARLPVLYWENSIGRSKSCDIYLPDASVSRDHAVLMRRDEGWVICDTGSKSGVFVNGKKVQDKKLLKIGDKITLGAATLSLWNSDVQPQRSRKAFTGFSKNAASPFKLMFAASLVHFLMAVQSCFQNGGFAPDKLIPFLAVLLMGWGLYVISMTIQKRVSFEIETIAYLLSGIGVNLLAAEDPDAAKTQIVAMFMGICLFSFLIWFMNDMERVAKLRLWIGLGALGLLMLTLVIGTEVYGAKGWIFLGPLSVQPSEFVKIAFIFVGTSTLDRLQTRKNIWEFLIFTGACMGCLALMNDFGTALIFFACFLIIAFMRSGSVRTIALVLVGAALCVFLILKFKPHVIARFAVWGNAWSDAYGDGFQQTRTLTYIASGGMFGMGLGQGYLCNMFASDSDLVFGMLCEEQGLALGMVVLLALGMLILYARSDVTRSRSTFFSIASCAAAGMLVFQACLNVFGPTDILPFTGVTLPFLSAGGSSMMGVWGLMAFLKASDERTYAARRASRHGAPSNRKTPDPARKGSAGRRGAAHSGSMEDIYS